MVVRGLCSTFASLQKMSNSCLLFSSLTMCWWDRGGAPTAVSFVGETCQISAFVANAVMSVATLVIVDGDGGVAISEACSRALGLNAVIFLSRRSVI